MNQPESAPNEFKCALRRETVLEGYYASGDYECFCFDKWDGPDAYHEKFPDDIDAQIAAEHENRVYPGELLPEGTGFGRWRIVVEFEPLEESE